MVLPVDQVPACPVVPACPGSLSILPARCAHNLPIVVRMSSSHTAGGTGVFPASAQAFALAPPILCQIHDPEFDILHQQWQREDTRGPDEYHVYLLTSSTQLLLQLSSCSRLFICHFLSSSVYSLFFLFFFYLFFFPSCSPFLSHYLLLFVSARPAPYSGPSFAPTSPQYLVPSHCASLSWPCLHLCLSATEKKKISK